MIEVIVVATHVGLLVGMFMLMMCFPLHRYEWADKMMTCGFVVTFGSASAYWLLILVAILAELVTK